MQKIVLINCFFGKFPWYFGLFLKTCESNKTIDFKIFSNYTFKDDLPNNVTILKLSLAEFNQRATNVLNLAINVKNAYKLCDFKPAYGLIFGEYIKEYDFWGVCDIDIVFGRIREFFTEELLLANDVISVTERYPSGFLLLFKNTPYINRLFTLSSDYQFVFTTEKHFCFDECNFVHDLLHENISINDIECEIESLHHLLVKEASLGRLKVQFGDYCIEGQPGKIEWNNGILAYNNEYEILLYHLIRFKSNVYSSKKKIVLNSEFSDVLYIDKYSIRNTHISKLKGYLHHIYYDKARFPFIHFFQKVELRISQLLAIFTKATIVKGTYEYWNSIFYVRSDNNGDTFILLEGTQKKFKIFPSILRKSKLFIKEFSSISIRMDMISENESNYLTWVYPDGHTKTYKLKTMTAEPNLKDSHL